MAQDLLQYDKMIEAALRGVVREALTRAARDGLPGNHHFNIGFRTWAPGVAIPDHLVARYPDEITIVLQHQFWDLEIGAEEFSVTLSFQNRPERLTVPFAAVSFFADPSVEFGLKFEAPPVDPAEPPALAVDAPKPEALERPEAEIVTRDKFRRR